MMFNLALLISFFILFSCALNRGEVYTAHDNQYWSLLLEEKRNHKLPLIKVLKNKSPFLFEQITKDTQDPLVLDFWGKSLNFDSGAKAKIIDDQIVAELHNLFAPLKQSYDAMIVHAGIAHTYGYLFSDLETPYGYKRKRWISPTLNFAFKLSGNSLAPFTNDGTLLSNVTYFAGMLAFKDPGSREMLKKLKNVSEEIRTFNFYNLTLEHMEEDLPLATLRTTLLRLPEKDVNDENDYFLIYSIWDKENKKENLITGFPISAEAYKKITDPSGLGKQKEITLRYNAYLEGHNDKKHTGNRMLWIETK